MRAADGACSCCASASCGSNTMQLSSTMLTRLGLPRSSSLAGRTRTQTVTLAASLPAAAARGAGRAAGADAGRGPARLMAQRARARLAPSPQTARTGVAEAPRDFPAPALWFACKCTRRAAAGALARALRGPSRSFRAARRCSLPSGFQASSCGHLPLPLLAPVGERRARSAKCKSLQPAAAGCVRSVLWAVTF